MIPFTKISQIAYVTSDIDKSVAIFCENYKISDFFIMRDVEISKEMGVLDIAMAYIEDVMIEIIAPHSGAAPIYGGDKLDSDMQAHRLHHIGVFVNDRSEFDLIRASALGMNLDIPMALEHETMDLFYVDTRKHFGHFIEYTLVHKAGKELFASLPRAGD